MAVAHLKPLQQGACLGSSSLSLTRRADSMCETVSKEQGSRVWLPMSCGTHQATSVCVSCRFGESLETSEQEWLVWEINQKIAEVKGAAPTMDDMPPEDRPEVGMVQ